MALPELPAHQTVELIIPMALYRRAQIKAGQMGEDMAHVARRILYAAVERTPPGPAPDTENLEPEPDTIAAAELANSPDGMRGGLGYVPNVAPGAAKTRDNTRGDNAAYKNFRFRVPRERYESIKSVIVSVPGQTVTYVLERGLLAYVHTGAY